MTLGKKIRKYRVLKGLTQRELGLAVGFSEATADSRIRKYELDIIKPKDSMREKIARALEVDLSAISDIDIATYEDVMRVLFLFEEAFGMEVEIRGGKIMLVFDNGNRRIQALLSSLKLWRMQKTVLLLSLQKTVLLLSRGSPTADQKKKYEIWKAGFTPARKNIPIFRVTVAHMSTYSLPSVPFRMIIIIIICDSLNELIYVI